MTVTKINWVVYDVQLQTSFLILRVVLASLQEEKDGSSYMLTGNWDSRKPVQILRVKRLLENEWSG